MLGLFVAGTLLSGLLAVFAPRALAPAAGLSALGIIILLVLQRQGRAFFLMRSTWLLGAAIVWMLLSAIWALQRQDALSTMHGLGPLLLSCALLGTAGVFLGHRLARRVMPFLLAAYIANAVFIVFEWHSRGLLTNWFFEHGVLLKPWELATTNRAIVLSSLLGWPVLIWARHWSERLAWLWILLVLASMFLLAQCGILLTARVALVAGVAAFLFFLAFGAHGAAIIAAQVALLVIAMPWLPANLLSPHLYEAWLPDIRFSGLHRLYIWQFAAERVAEHPLIGWGLDASRSMPGGQEIIPVPGSNGPNMPLHPHNGIMQVWVELGLIGALLLAALLVQTIRAISRSGADRLAQAAALGAFVTGLVFFSAAFGAWQGWWVGTMALGAGWMAVALRASNPGN